MSGFTVTATIDRPVDEVWTVLTDWSRAPEWMAGIDAMAVGGPTQVGTPLTFSARGRERSSEVVAVEPGRSVTLRSTQGGVTADYAYTLAAVDGGATEASLHAECRATGVWKLLMPVIAPAMRRSDGGQMDALKALVEA